MIHSKGKTWILLADGARAKVFCQDGAHLLPRRVMEMESKDARKSAHELGVDRPGHGQSASDVGRYAMEGHTTEKELASKTFIEDVAYRINKLAAEEDMGDLILVALPKTLAALKGHLAKPTLDHVKTELTKDLIGIPEQDLGDHLDCFRV